MWKPYKIKVSTIFLFEGLLYLCYFIKAVLLGESGEYSIKRWLLCVLAGNLEGTTSYWYLYAYLGIMIMLPFLQRMFRDLEKKYELLFVIIWFVFLIAYRVLDRLNMNIGYPLPIIGSTYYVGYFVLGHLICKYLKEIKIKRAWLYVIRYGSLLITILLMCYGSFSRNKHYYYSAESPSESIQTTAAEHLHPCRDCSFSAMPFPSTTLTEYLHSY